MEENIKDTNFELITQLNNVVDALVKANENQVDENVTSLEFTGTKIYGDAEQVKSFFTDYGKYFGEVTNPKNTKVNPFHKSKYAPLDEVMNTIRPIMSKYGLSLIQIPAIKNGKVLINSILTHKGGGYMTIESLEMPMQKPDAQGIGGAITYGRRYNASAIGGVMSEEDDDGNSASGLPNSPKQDNASKPDNSSSQKSTPQTNGKSTTLAQLKVKANTEAKALFTSKGEDNVRAKIDEILDGGTIATTTEENKDKLEKLIDELKKM